MSTLTSFGTGLNAVVIGAGGGIGGAFLDHLESDPAVGRILACARRPEALAARRAETLALDVTDEASIGAAAETARAFGPLHLVIVATGILHAGDTVQPEKSWSALDAASMDTVFRINTTGPALAAKHFLPLLDRDRKSVFAALSARVGSISDNRLGGWYAYRASKAALNMMLRCAAIELARKNKLAACVGLHPGTVNTDLSAPFQRGVADGKLFTPDFSAGALLQVIDRLDAQATGRVFAWDGEEVPA